MTIPPVSTSDSNTSTTLKTLVRGYVGTCWEGCLEDCRPSRTWSPYIGNSDPGTCCDVSLGVHGSLSARHVTTPLHLVGGRCTCTNRRSTEVRKNGPRSTSPDDIAFRVYVRLGPSALGRKHATLILKLKSDVSLTFDTHQTNDIVKPRGVCVVYSVQVVYVLYMRCVRVCDVRRVCMDTCVYPLCVWVLVRRRGIKTPVVVMSLIH